MPNAENKVKFGLTNVHYAVQTAGEGGAVAFGTPKRLPGAVNLSLPPQGEKTEFYADNILYYATNANNGYAGDLEIANITEDFSIDVLKEELDETDKVLVEKAQAEGAVIALLFEFSGDKHSVRHVLYACTVARPNVDGSTTGSTKEPSTSTLSITAAPLADGLVKARTTANTPQETYDNWYSAVWMPPAEASSVSESDTPLGG